MESFKLANTCLKKFNLSSLGRIETIVDLDLSFNTIVFDSLNTLTNIRSIKLSKVKFEQNNSLVKFLNKNVIELDFSENSFANNFGIFNNLKNLESLSLRNVNLYSMEQINFQNFLKLKILDLSRNNKTRVLFDSLKNLKLLEYLDLGFNQIEFIDERILDDWVDFKAKQLKYLNLESNRIKKFESFLFNFLI